jgi:hypothetical protein
MARPAARTRFGLLVMVALGLACSGAQAELRALLVGVSAYPTLPERLQLQGPRNDVQRMRQVLLQRGFAEARIQVLADGVTGAALPTRANILTALESLATAAQHGDTVFIHFAGHGSRQPADRRNPAGREEPGGLNETFLPIDIGTWDGSANTVKNAIVNFELRAAVDRITARGAFVWGVFDACHSATLVRGSESADLRYRHIEPGALGIPQAELDRATAEVPAIRGTTSTPPGALDSAARPAEGRRPSAAFFYATQIHELTPELHLPAGDPKGQPYGLFSFVVGRAIERSQPMSYRQMAQYILSEYGAIVEARATPLFSGDGLDEPVFGQGTLPPRQWPLEVDNSLGVAVGSLFEIGAGAVFAVLPGPLAKESERVGYLQVVTTEPAHASLAPIAYDGHQAPAVASLRPGQYLRLVHNPPQYSLHVAFDPAGCAADCVLRAAIQRLRTQGVPGVDVQWVDMSAAPDILVQLLRGRAVFLPTTQQADDAGTKASALGIDIRDDGKPVPAETLAAQLASELHSIARARNLLVLAARFAAEARSGGLVTTLRRAGNGTPIGQAIAPDQVPTLHNGEQLSLVVENRGTVSQDVTVLYADADQGISTLFPTRLAESNRIEPGARQTIDGIVIGTPPTGIEHLLLIAVEARPQSERADFSFLQQPALNRKRGTTSDDLDAFADAAFAEFKTRGASRPAVPSGRTSMQVFTLNVAR